MSADRPRLAARLVRTAAVATVLALAGTACAGVTADQPTAAGATVSQLTIATSFAVDDSIRQERLLGAELGYGELLISPPATASWRRGC